MFNLFPSLFGCSTDQTRVRVPFSELGRRFLFLTDSTGSEGSVRIFHLFYYNTNL